MGLVLVAVAVAASVAAAVDVDAAREEPALPPLEDGG